MTTQIVQAILNHAPGDKRSYGIDFVDELNGQAIISAVWASSGLTKSVETIEGTKAELYLAGGVDNTEYVVSCTITTDANEIFTRSILLVCREL